MKTLNKLTGNIGEALACNFLKQKKYTILQTNYKSKIGEIDIIAWQDNVLHFIEVKNRSSDLVPGRYAVDTKKQRHIRQTAQAYLVQNRLVNECLVSFDVIEITDGKLEFLENCFY